MHNGVLSEVQVVTFLILTTCEVVESLVAGRRGGCHQNTARRRQEHVESFPIPFPFALHIFVGLADFTSTSVGLLEAWLPQPVKFGSVSQYRVTSASLRRSSPG